MKILLSKNWLLATFSCTNTSNEKNWTFQGHFVVHLSACGFFEASINQIKSHGIFENEMDGPSSKPLVKKIFKLSMFYGTCNKV